MLQYTDDNNEQVLITSSTNTELNTRAKLTDTMVTALSSYSASTSYYDGNLFPSYIKIMPNSLSEESSTLFDMKDVVVKSAMVTGDNTGIFASQASEDKPFIHTITPLEPLFRFDSDQQQFVQTNIAYVLKDANSDTEISKQVVIKYCRSFYTAPVTEISAAVIKGSVIMAHNKIEDS